MPRPESGFALTREPRHFAGTSASSAHDERAGVSAHLGVPPGDIPPATPCKVLYSVNLKTARQIKITISEQLAKKALNIY
jgi:hypothetical protein